jgi:hypothetical protein
MASYLSLSYQAMEKVLQKLNAVLKDEYASLPFAISPQKVESPTKNINDQPIGFISKSSAQKSKIWQCLTYFINS